MNEVSPKQRNAAAWYARLSSPQHKMFVDALFEWRRSGAVAGTAPYVLRKLGRQIALWVLGWTVSGVWTGLLGYNALHQWIEDQQHGDEVVYIPCTPGELWIGLSTSVVLLALATLPFSVNAFIRYFSVSSVYNDERRSLVSH